MAVRPINETLARIGGGLFLDEASEELNKLVQIIESTGKGGSITMKITIKKATRGGAMLVAGDVKVTKPPREPMEALMFATVEGNLVADDPNQMKLELKDVSNASSKPIELGVSTGVDGKLAAAGGQ